MTKNKQLFLVLSVSLQALFFSYIQPRLTSLLLELHMKFKHCVNLPVKLHSVCYNQISLVISMRVTEMS